MESQPQDANLGRRNKAAADVGTYMMELLNAFEKGVAEETAVYDMTPVEFNLLRICLEEGECTATQLARMLPVDASRISRIVARLVDDGLLIRRRLRNDRRIVMLRLSEEGIELTSQMHLRVQAFDDKLTEGINETDMRTFASVAAKMLDNYSAIGGLGQSG